MEIALSAAFVLGFLGGFKHAFEPDHVVAVSTLMHRTERLGQALRLGVAWGAGHTTMLMAAVLVIGLLRMPISEDWLAYFEIPVAIMLLALGAWALYGAVASLLRLWRHKHDGIPHFHVGEHDHPHGFAVRRTGWPGFAVGLVHGLAGSAALVLLVAATLPTTLTSLVYALVFGIGSVLGMGAVTLALAATLRASRARPTFYHALTGLAGMLSMVLGGSLLVALL